jgi:phosphoribosylanthranilate isomerase
MKNLTVKICGLTNLDDAQAALRAGADYLGFVLYEGSPRCVSAAVLREIVRQLPADARAVGVFVNARRADVQQVAQACRLYAVQIHGDEPIEDFRDMPVVVWRAVKLTRGAWAPDPARWPAGRYVMDAATPGKYGGSGEQTDWPSARTFAQRHPAMLAGGLTPDSVAEAVARVHPLGVDVSSGVEAGPGRKDARKVAEFIRSAKQASRSAE